MNTLIISSRRLFRKSDHPLTRIISLTAGLSLSILLFSEVFYYQSYDSFYPDSNRIYTIQSNFKTDKSSDKISSYDYVSGAIAPGLKAEVPGIEAACRLNSMGSSVFYTEDQKSYNAKFSLADEYVFDVLSRPVISGNPKEVLKSPMTCMVSSKVAKEIGGDVVGKMIEIKEFPSKKLTIGGIFKALPENTSFHYDVLVSMVSTSQFMWDGTMNWLGNDRYYACVKLEPGVSHQSLAPAIRLMQEKHQDIIRLEKIQKGSVVTYSLNPIKEVYARKVKDWILILSAIGFAVLFVSLLNYTLLTLSALVNRAKTSAIYKTCGAQTTHLQKMIFNETLLLFLISLVGAFLVILVLKPLAETQIGHKLTSSLNSYVVVPILLLLVTLVFLISYLPGRFFSRIPVATAFRNYKQKSSKWKLGLLSLQFIGASFILTMLVIVSMQYNKLQNANHGYNSENVYYCTSSGITSSKLPTVLNELRAIPEIELVGLGYGIPFEGASGNNISLPNSEKELFNVADFYWIDENYMSILNIPVTQGKAFSQESTIPNEILISQKGAQMLAMNTGWNDGVVGKEIKLSAHGINTISGVFPDFIIHSITNPDNRAAVFSYSPEERFQAMIEEYPSFSFNILIKTHQDVHASIVKRITDVINLALPQKDAIVKSFQTEQLASYASEKGFRNAMIASNFIILIITIMGLMGYTIAEASRRQKELAIRKISGAKLSDILSVFIMELEYVALPAVLAGLIGAWFIAGKWMENFASKIHLHWGIFTTCSISILVLIAFVATINYITIANRNPIEALKHE